MLYYSKIWLRLTLSAFQVALISRFGAGLFVVAKTIRFAFFLLVALLVIDKTDALAGYTLTQFLVLYLTFNVIDTTTQLLFRDVYRFRQKIVSGDFDLILVKPISPLFRVLLGGADPMDLIMLVPYMGLLIWFVLQTPVNFITVITFIILVINAFLLATAFHISVLALGILTTEIDHAIMIYRDLTSMGRFPVDIYGDTLRALITFVIPVGIMMTFPPKALFGLLSPLLLVTSVLIGSVFFGVSLKLWNYALSKYASASS